MTAFRIAAIQMCSGVDPSRNLEQAGLLLAEAASRGACLAGLPENFALMAAHEADKLAIAEEPGRGEIQSFLAQAARRHGIWIIGGTVPLRTADPARVAAACLVYDPLGNLAARYDKIHLFDVAIPGRDEHYTESATVQAGTEPVCVDTPAGRVGLAVCYDLRFPELFRRLQAGGAEWFCLPSAFTAPTGRAHWETLLRARAIENLCGIVAPAQSGFHENGRETHGDTMIVDCWGRVLARLPRGTGVVLGEIDLVRQREVRQNFPAVDHRRLTN